MCERRRWRWRCKQRIVVGLIEKLEYTRQVILVYWQPIFGGVRRSHFILASDPHIVSGWWMCVRVHGWWKLTKAPELWNHFYCFVVRFCFLFFVLSISRKWNGRLTQLLWIFFSLLFLVSCPLFIWIRFISMMINVQTDKDTSVFSWQVTLCCFSLSMFVGFGYSIRHNNKFFRYFCTHK